MKKCRNTFEIANKMSVLSNSISRGPTGDRSQEVLNDAFHLIAEAMTHLESAMESMELKMERANNAMLQSLQEQGQRVQNLEKRMEEIELKVHFFPEPNAFSNPDWASSANLKLSSSSPSSISLPNDFQSSCPFPPLVSSRNSNSRPSYDRVPPPSPIDEEQTFSLGTPGIDIKLQSSQSHSSFGTPSIISQSEYANRTLQTAHIPPPLSCPFKICEPNGSRRTGGAHSKCSPCVVPSFSEYSYNNGTPVGCKPCGMPPTNRTSNLGGQPVDIRPRPEPPSPENPFSTDFREGMPRVIASLFNAESPLPNRLNTVSVTTRNPTINNDSSSNSVKCHEEAIGDPFQFRETLEIIRENLPMDSGSKATDFNLAFNLPTNGKVLNRTNRQLILETALMADSSSLNSAQSIDGPLSSTSNDSKISGMHNNLIGVKESEPLSVMVIKTSISSKPPGTLPPKNSSFPSPNVPFSSKHPAPMISVAQSTYISHTPADTGCPSKYSSTCPCPPACQLNYNPFSSNARPNSSTSDEALVCRSSCAYIDEKHSSSSSSESQPVESPKLLENKLIDPSTKDETTSTSIDEEETYSSVTSETQSVDSPRLLEDVSLDASVQNESTSTSSDEEEKSYSVSLETGSVDSPQPLVDESRDTSTQLELPPVQNLRNCCLTGGVCRKPPKLICVPRARGIDQQTCTAVSLPIATCPLVDRVLLRGCRGLEECCSSKCSLMDRLSLGKNLLKAVQNGKASQVRSLLENGADVNFTHGSKWTPLHRAARKADACVVSQLLRKGANVKSKACYGFTPLHMAAFNDTTGKCVCLLIQAGSDISSRNRSGRTPLHYAAECGNLAAVQALVAAGANRTLKDVEGKTPLDLASPCVRKYLL